MKRSKRGFRPSVVGLEKREVLSVFTVTNLGDSGPGSLRAAITASNTNPAPAGSFNTVAFNPMLGGVIALTSGHLDITTPVHINDGTAGTAVNPNIVISGSNRSRIFETHGVAAEIDNLSLENGRAASSNSTPGTGGGDGGAIQEDGGDLTLRDDTLANNFATNRGGAVFNYYGTLNALGSSFYNNSTPHYGGAIYNSGTMTVSTQPGMSVFFLGNTAGEGGGAVENASSVLAIPQVVTAYIILSTFEANSAGSGGAIGNQNGADLHLNGNTFIGNHASTNGGALLNSATADDGTTVPPGNTTPLLGSTFEDNTAGIDGGAIYSQGALTLSAAAKPQTTIQFNTAAPGGGGGVWVADPGKLTRNAAVIQFNTQPDVQFG